MRMSEGPKAGKGLHWTEAHEARAWYARRRGEGNEFGEASPRVALPAEGGIGFYFM